MLEHEWTMAVLTGLAVDPMHPGLAFADRQRLVTMLREGARELPLLAPLDLGERLLDAVTAALKKPVASVLEEVWKQRKELRDAAGKTLGEPAPSSEVELFGHTIDWGVHPRVTVTVDGASTTLKLDVIVKLTVAGAKLVIERACITRFLSGTLTSSIAIKFRHIEFTTPYRGKINLAGEFVLPQGGIDLIGTTDAHLPASRASEGVHL